MLLDYLWLLFSVVVCEFDIASLTLCIDSLLIKFYELDFFCIRDVLFNWHHVHNYLLNDGLNCFFYLVEVSYRSSKLDSIQHDDDLGLVILLKKLYKILVLNQFSTQFYFLFGILNDFKPYFFTFGLLQLRFLFFLFEILTTSSYLSKLNQEFSILPFSLNDFLFDKVLGILDFCLRFRPNCNYDSSRLICTLDQHNIVPQAYLVFESLKNFFDKLLFQKILRDYFFVGN